MALSAGALSSLIQSNLQAVGANGANLQKFCSAVAAGIVMSIVGKSFVTVDTGLVPGIGTGTGTGIIGLSSSLMKSTALSMLSSTGKNADKLMQAIMDATVSHLANASLSTNDAPVFQGAGIITPGTITVVGSQMGSNILSQLQAVNAKGKNVSQLAMAIGAGVCISILSTGTGNLTITGTFTGPTPPGPIPGTGAGVGTIS